MPAVFVSYGINASELNYDDYAGVDVAGKDGNRACGHAGWRQSSWPIYALRGVRWKAIAAKNAGAKALLVIVPEANLKGALVAAPA